MAEARVYIVTGATLTCAAGRFEKGARVFAPWLNGQEAQLERLGLIADLGVEAEVPDVEEAGDPGWASAEIEVRPGRVSIDEEIAARLAVDPGFGDHLLELLAGAEGGELPPPVDETAVVEGIAGVVPVPTVNVERLAAEVAGLNIGQVLALVDARPDLADAVLEAELGGKARATLVRDLRALAAKRAVAAPAAEEV